MMRCNTLLFALLSLAAPGNVGLAECTLNGHVRDYAIDTTGQNPGIAGVTVRIMLKGQLVQKTLTQTDGSYIAEQLPAGPLRIEYEHFEYLNAAPTEVTVKSGQVETVDVYLVAASISKGYSLRLARQLWTSAKANGGSKEDYAEQWNWLQKRGISPLTSVYVAHELHEVWPAAEKDLPAARPYLKTESVKAAKLYYEFEVAFHNGVYILEPNVGEGVSDKYVAETLRYIMKHSARTQAQHDRFFSGFKKSWDPDRVNRVEAILRNEGDSDL